MFSSRNSRAREIRRALRSFVSGWLHTRSASLLEERVLPTAAIFQPVDAGGPIYGEAQVNFIKNEQVADSYGTQSPANSGTYMAPASVSGSRTVTNFSYPYPTTFSEDADLSVNTVTGPPPPADPPALGPSNTNNVEADVTHGVNTDTVSTTAPPPGFTLAPGTFLIAESTTAETINPLNWVIEDDTDGVVGGKSVQGASVQTTFAISLSTTTPLFQQAPVLTIRSTFMNVDLNDGDAPAGDLQITNPANGAVLYSNPDFGNGAGNAYSTPVSVLPNTTSFGIYLSYCSIFTTGPLGPFTAAGNPYSQTSQFNWSITINLTTSGGPEVVSSAPPGGKVSPVPHSVQNPGATLPPLDLGMGIDPYSTSPSDANFVSATTSGVTASQQAAPMDQLLGIQITPQQGSAKQNSN